MKKLFAAIIILISISSTVVSAGTAWFRPDSVAPIELRTSSVSLGSTGNAVTAVSGKVIKIYSYALTTSVTSSVAFRDGSTTSLSGAMPLAANTPIANSVTPPAFLFSTASGTSFDIVMTGPTASVRGTISYWLE